MNFLVKIFKQILGTFKKQTADGYWLFTVEETYIMGFFLTASISLLLLIVSGIISLMFLGTWQAIVIGTSFAISSTVYFGTGLVEKHMVIQPGRQAILFIFGKARKSIRLDEGRPWILKWFTKITIVQTSEVVSIVVVDGNSSTDSNSVRMYAAIRVPKRVFDIKQYLNIDDSVRKDGVESLIKEHVRKYMRTKTDMKLLDEDTKVDLINDLEAKIEKMHGGGKRQLENWGLLFGELGVRKTGYINEEVIESYEKILQTKNKNEVEVQQMRNLTTNANEMVRLDPSGKLTFEKAMKRLQIEDNRPGMTEEEKTYTFTDAEAFAEVIKEIINRPKN